MDTDNRHLKSLSEEQKVRQKPNVVFGSNDAEGCVHGVKELIANSADEARNGFGDKIIISMSENGEICVEDFGRGIFMGWNETEQKYDWELAFCTMYASGKYDSSMYSNALGTNGLGLASTQFASEYMVAESVYNDTIHIMKFEKGLPVGELVEIPANGRHTGTRITYKPDKSVFVGWDGNVLPAEMFITYLRRQAMLLPGVQFEFHHCSLNNPICFKYDKGIADFLDEIIEKPIIKTLYFKGDAEGTDNPEQNPEPYKVDMQFALNFSRVSPFVEVYHNASFLSLGGSSMKGMQAALTSFFSEAGHELGKLPQKERFSFKDIEDVISIILSTDADGYRTYFLHQTKTEIRNPFIGRAVADFMADSLMTWYNRDKAAVEKVVNEIALNKKAREEAAKVTKKLVQSLSKAVSIGDEPPRFIDCSSTNPLERELYIVEGASALGSVITSRDARFQAALPVRGKTINCLKESLSRVLSSDIVTGIFRVLGCGIEAKSKHIDGLPPFDLSKLRYNKIIICTDADLDGSHIVCLLVTMFYVLCPSLLKAGKVYIAQTPLFTISYKDDSCFAYSDEQRDQILRDFINKGYPEHKIVIERSKGLGENGPEMMSISTMNPLTRVLVQVEYNDDIPNVPELFNAFLGDDIETRRELIEEYFEITQSDLE